MPIRPGRTRTTCGILAALAAGCSGGDQAAPAAPVMAVAKADTLSGDQQVGIAGRELGAPLRVMVTRDDVPVPGVPGGLGMSGTITVTGSCGTSCDE